MPKTYTKNKELDIYNLAEMTGQSVEELAEGFREAEDDIKNGRTEDAFVALRKLNKKYGIVLH